MSLSSPSQEYAVKSKTHKPLVALAALAALLAFALPLSAQEESPKPAGTSLYPLPPVNVGDQDENSPNALNPDVTPLTGVQNPTLGSPEVRHSYWVPGFQWSGAIQSNSYNQNANSSWIMNNYLVGNFSLLEAWSHAEFDVNYSAGGFFSSDTSQQGNDYYHQLALSQTFRRNRWTLQLLDQFSYLPQSSIGFGGGTGLGTPTGGGTGGPVIPGINNNYVPNQSIFAAVGARYSNASSVQLTYNITRRGSLTFSGSYGLLNFIDPGNVDNDTTTGTIGYNYALSRKNTIGMFYRFSAYHYSGQPEANGDHSANFAYSRKVTGRLALQLFGGPEFTTSRVVVPNGNSVTYGVNSGANLIYAFPKGGFNVGYTHGMSGGSGVLTGTTADQLTASATHKLSRIWTGQINFSFAHNAPLSNAPNATTQTFNTWNAGGGVSRPLGRNSSLAIAYNATLTDYALGGCTGAACSSSNTFNYVTINFQWHTRPLVLP